MRALFFKLEMRKQAIFFLFLLSASYIKKVWIKLKMDSRFAVWKYAQYFKYSKVRVNVEVEEVS